MGLMEEKLSWQKDPSNVVVCLEILHGHKTIRSRKF